MTPMPIGSLLTEQYPSVDATDITTRHGVLNLPKSEKLSKKQESFLRLARQMAEVSDLDMQHGAVVVKSGRVMAVGVNKWRNKELRLTPGAEFQNVLSVHAEIDALSRIEDARGAVVFVARRDGGTDKFSRPCHRCMAELIRRGVKRVVYTA